MAKRSPLSSIPSSIELEEQLKSAQSNTEWRTYRCELVTPMYGAGVKAGEVDKEMPIRATEIRGHLRFWWRLLNKKRYSTPKELFKKEREIWGGLGKDDDLEASKVDIRINKFSGTNLVNSKSESNPGIKYVFGQGDADWLDKGLKFEIGMKYPADISEQIEETFQWWANFGGLGAKTRRGFGAIKIEGADEVTTDRLAICGCLISWAETEATALSAWYKANEKLHKFRQGRGFARGYGKEKPSRSFWPEPDQLRRDSNKNDEGRHQPEHKAGNVFARAAFGLPIIFDFRKATEPSKTELLPAGDKDRMASPLILRPCIHGGKWTATAILLPQWKDAVTQPLRYKNGNGNPKNWPTDEKLRKQVAQLIQPMTKDDKLRGDDPLSAFMSFFREHQSQNTEHITSAVKLDEVWEKAKIKFNRQNGALYAESDGKPQAVAQKEVAESVLASLGKDAEKVRRGDFYRAKAIVNGTKLIRLEVLK